MGIEGGFDSSGHHSKPKPSLGSTSTSTNPPESDMFNQAQLIRASGVNCNVNVSNPYSTPPPSVQPQTEDESIENEPVSCDLF